MLSGIPVDVLNLIPMNTKTAKAFALTCTSHLLFFTQANNNLLLTYKLLQCVEEADYDKAEHIVKNHSQLIFQHVNFTYANENEEYISPLKCAIKLLDTYMWKKIFFDAIKNDTKNINLFLRETTNQIEHISLQPLFDTYEKYETLQNRWYKEEEENKRNLKLDENWLKLGEAQRLFIPWHMFREFCRKGESWKKHSFSVELHERPGICKVSRSKLADLDLMMSIAMCGVNFTLIRIGWSEGRAAYILEEVEKYIGGYVKEDWAAFSCLYQTRLDDLKQIPLLVERASQEIKNGSTEIVLHNQLT